MGDTFPGGNGLIRNVDYFRPTDSDSEQRYLSTAAQM